MRSLLLLASILLTCPCPYLQTEEIAPREKSPSPLARVGVLGASVSAGFGDVWTLAQILDSAIKPPHCMVDEARVKLSKNPLKYAESALKNLKKKKATLVIGIDFFFWFSYGPYTFERRKAILQQGCTMAETLDCPLVVGDLPDVHHSNNLLRHLLAPSSEEVKLLNSQLRTWAGKHANVFVLPISEWMETLIQGKSLVINGKATPYTKEKIFLPDQVHTTTLGTALLAMKVLDEMAAHYPGLEKNHFVLDLDELARAIQKKEEARKASQAKSGKTEEKSKQ